MQVFVNHLIFVVFRVRILASDQVAETCDACDRKEDLRALLFLYYGECHAKKDAKTLSYL